MSAHLSGGSLGFALAPVLFAPFIASMGLAWSPLVMIPGLLALSWTLRQVPPMTLPAAHERSSWATLRPAAVAADAALLHDRPAHGDDLRLHDVRADAADATGLGDRRGEHGRLALSVASGIGGFLGGPLADRFGARRVIVWTLVASVPFMAVAPLLAALGLHGDAGHRRPAAAVHAADQRDLRPDAATAGAPRQCRR